MTKVELVVTRHPALVAHLLALGLVDESVAVLSHASEADVAGKHVAGVLPLRLAALAASVTEVPLALTAEHRGVELDLATVQALAGEPVTYVVTRQK